MSDLPLRRSPGKSLRVRMLLSAALVLTLFLGVMGLVLDNAYRLSAEQSVAERLLLHIYALITASEQDESGQADSLYLPEALQEPLFNQVESGLYGFVFDADGEEVWRSRSAVTLNPAGPLRSRIQASASPGVVDFYRLDAALAGAALFGLSYRVRWQVADDEAEYIYVVLQDLVPFRKEVAAFRNNLWGWLVAGVLLLVALQGLIMYWGLLPIGRLEADLKAIEAGDQDYLTGAYPREIDGVTRHLNLLLQGERAQRERYRNTLADLAHSLKTPLAIISGEIDRSDRPQASVRQTLAEQVSRMNDLVSYQLERALLGSGGLVRESAEVRPVVEKLVAALDKVYSDKAPDFRLVISEVAFPGDARDLMELLGNLMDNACKYGRGRVRVSALRVDDRLKLVVEDDGDGISDQDRDNILQRGRRLDTQAPGQGIGLAVVAEIVARYRGSVSVEASDLGGAAFIVLI